MNKGTSEIQEIEKNVTKVGANLFNKASSNTNDLTQNTIEAALRLQEQRKNLMFRKIQPKSTTQVVVEAASNGLSSVTSLPSWLYGKTKEWLGLQKAEATDDVDSEESPSFKKFTP